MTAIPANDCLFPVPSEVVVSPVAFDLCANWRIQSETLAVPEWLADRLRSTAEAACGPAANPDSAGVIIIVSGSLSVDRLPNGAIAEQGYTLELKQNRQVVVTASTIQGVQHALVTFIQLLQAAGQGATLSCMVITDAPACEVRGLQVDLARSFFPPLTYLKRLVDRCVFLKINALWLYLENRFKAPGYEDIAAAHALTPEDARRLSDYGSARHVDIVPATNVISHMEGWFKLERYTDLCDGPIRSYPDTTHPDLPTLTTGFLDALMDAFPSRNFHAGFDELYKAGRNPRVAAAFESQGKAGYYGQYARKTMQYIQSKGKRVWMWDDMVMGQNVYRPEGLNDDYPIALDAIPQDVVMVHWYYETNQDGKHGPVVERIAKIDRPLAIASGTQSVHREYPGVTGCSSIFNYMAQVAQDLHAMAHIITQWNARYGMSHEAHWPLMALGAAYTWTGPQSMNDQLLSRLAFALSGRLDSQLPAYFRLLDDIELLMAQPQINLRGKVRKILFSRGADGLWMLASPKLKPEVRKVLRDLLTKARELAVHLKADDALLVHALQLPPILYSTILDVIDAYDRAWHAYHQASLLQRAAGQEQAYQELIQQTAHHLQDACHAMDPLRLQMIELEATGHNPYDAILLERWQERIDAKMQLLHETVTADIGLPAFYFFMDPPDAVHAPNLDHFITQHTARPLPAEYPWPRRWGDEPAGTEP